MNRPTPPLVQYRPRYGADPGILEGGESGSSKRQVRKKFQNDIDKQQQKNRGGGG